MADPKGKPKTPAPSATASKDKKDKWVVLNLRGLSRLSKSAAVEVINTVKTGMGDLVTKAEANLMLTQKDSDPPPEAERAKTWVWLEIIFDEDEPAADPCDMIVAECGSGSVSVTRARQLSVCGTDPKTRNTRFLTNDSLLGKALGNTALHELGHKIANLNDNRDAGNVMSDLGPPKETRTIESQRAFWAGKLSWNESQAAMIVGNLKQRRLAGDFSVGK